MQWHFHKATTAGCILGIASVLLAALLASTSFAQAGGGGAGAGGGSGAGGSGAGSGSAAAGGVGAGAGGTGTGASGSGVTGSTGSAGLSTSPTAASDQPQLNQPQNRNATDQPQVGASQGTLQSGQLGNTANPNTNQLDAQRQRLDAQRQTLMQDQSQLNSAQRRTLGRAAVPGALDQAEPADQTGRSLQSQGRNGLIRGNAPQNQRPAMQGAYGARGPYGARGYANQPQYNTGYRGTNPQVMGTSRAVLGVDLDGRYPHAAVVGRVHPGSGAAGAGLMPGDTIRSVNNLPINSSQDLMAAISRLQPGESVKVGFMRPSNAEIRLGMRPLEGAAPPAVTPSAPPATEGTLGAPDPDQVRPTSGPIKAGPATPRTTAGIPGQGVDADAISTGPTPGSDTDVDAGRSTTTP